jgi:hypothetical protein
MLFGRAHALDTVAQALGEARAGRGRLLLVSGDAGIGKTAVAAQLLREAPGAGVRVTWASCRPDSGAPPYWPWVQALRGLGAGEPGPLPAPPASAEDLEAARFRLHDGIASALVRAGTDAPVTVVLDDLHWSDEPSLLVLSFVAEQIRTARVLVLGTYREAEAGPRLLDLARSATVLELDGLAEPDVARLMTGVTGTAPDPDVVSLVWRRTGGNPFFAREVTRLLVAGPGVRGPVPDLVPAGVREVLRQRLSRLSAGCAELMGHAAVLGTESTMDVLGRLAGLDPDEVTALVEEAVRAAVMVRPPAPAGRVRFVHDLFRATVYDALDPADRTRRHLAAARVLGEPTEREVSAAELAAHFLRGGPAGADEAVRYSALAGEEAAGRLAHEDACGHFERALAALSTTAAAAGTRLRLLLGLGAAQHRSGRPDEARSTLRDAVAAARELSDVDALATAALGLQRLGARAGTLDVEVDSVLAEAIAAAEPDSPVLPSLLAARARTLHHSHLEDPPAEVRQLAARAVRLARTGGDPGTVAACLLALHDAHWRPGSARDRLPIVDEMARYAERAGDVERSVQARQLRAAALIELGDPRGVTELATYCRLANDLGHPHARWNAVTRRATLMLITGDGNGGTDGGLDAATALIAAGAALGTGIGEPDALGAANTQAFALTLLGRKAPDVAPPVSTYGAREHPVLVAFHQHAHGRRREAAATMAGYRFADSPRSHDPEPLILTAFMLAEYGTDEERRRAYDDLLPLAGTHSVVGGCASYQGAVDHHLTALAVALGWHDRAAAHLATATGMYERLGAPLWLARVRELAARPAAVFRRDGDLWLLGFDGRTVRVPDAKGLHDLATLLAAPGTPVHVSRLLAPAAVPFGGGDPVLDDRARAAYKARLVDLEEDIDRASADNDPERAAQARAEREFLVAELAAATGLGNRTRRLGDANDKARKTVTARIRYTIGRIRRVHPALAAHLDAHVHTGVECEYRPVGPVRWQL